MSATGLMWLIMVGMDTADVHSRGILGVVMRKRVESPEEQYDRLVSPPPPYRNYFKAATFCKCACFTSSS